MAEEKIIDEVNEDYDDFDDTQEDDESEGVQEVEKVTLKQRFKNFSEKHPKIVRTAKTIGVFTLGAAVTYVGGKVIKVVRKPKVEDVKAIADAAPAVIETAAEVVTPTAIDTVTEAVPDVIEAASDVAETVATEATK